MKLQHMKTILIAAFTLMLSNPAMAGFDITRMTTVVDDLSGSYTVSKSGRLENAQFTGTSLTEFNQFHPGRNDNEATISGVISKQTSRADGKLITTSDGSFTLESLNASWDVSFNGLQVEVNELGVELSGIVDVNDESYDVVELPTHLAKLLRRVFWLTRR